MANIFQKAVGWMKANPGYTIGGAGGVGFIVYLVYKQNQANAQSNTASGASGTSPTDATSQFASGDMNATPSYDYLYGYYEGDTGSTSGSSGFQEMPPAPGPPPPTPPPPAPAPPPTSPPPGMNPPPAQQAPVYYTIKSGDTIASIYAAAQKLDPGHFWGESGIQTRNAILKGFSFTAKLPASLVGKKVQVGGPLPTGGGYHWPWQKALTTHMSLWSGVAEEYGGVN